VAKKIILISFLLYLAVAGLLHTPFYDFCVLTPSKKADPARLEAIQGAEKRKIIIPAFGHQIQAWLITVKGSKDLAIVHHGRGGNLYNRAFLAQQLVNQKLSVLLYDYRGYGESTGVVRLIHLIPDGLLVNDFANSKLGYAPSQIITVGESIGTGTACAVAQERRCAAIFLQSPFTSLPQEAKDSFPLLHIYPDWCFPNPKFENIDYVKTPHPPLLIIHGEGDKQIPSAHSRSLFDAALEPKQLVLLPHAGHRNVGGEDAEMYTKALTGFFGNVLKEKIKAEKAH
jgi:fermentation-respiration switch protein FrsA (DUF1100 family)